VKREKKERIIEILSESFRDNKSTNFVIKQDHKREFRLRRLIEYSIFYGENFGEVFLTEDNNACYIILDTERKRTTLKSIIWDLKLIFQCIGLKNVRKVLKRESLIKSNHPKNDFIHLWYIGVHSSDQGKGLGTKQMKKIIDQARSQNKSIYLETSTERNFKFYKNLGFHEEVTIDQLGYSLKMFSLQ